MMSQFHDYNDIITGGGTCSGTIDPASMIKVTSHMTLINKLSMLIKLHKQKRKIEILKKYVNIGFVNSNIMMSQFHDYNDIITGGGTCSDTINPASMIIVTSHLT